MGQHYGQFYNRVIENMDIDVLANSDGYMTVDESMDS